MINYLIIFLALSISFLVNPAFADCNIDNDWQEKPCLDMPPYPKAKLVQLWDEYYSMKGQEWMEMKKSEMDYAIENKILQKWLSSGTQYKNNFQNHNAYFYYFLNDKAPAVDGYYFAEQLIQKEDRNPDVKRYPSDLSDNNLSTVIITYYYVNNGGLMVLSSVIAVIGTIGFFGSKRIIVKYGRTRK